MFDISAQVDISDLDLASLITITNQALLDNQVHHPIACIMTDDSHIQQLNQNYRNIDKPTDVLSFDLGDPMHPGHDYLGEVYISVERARVQAQEHGRLLQEEITHLAVHGILHILGFEHDTESGYEQMQNEERKYLALL